MHITVNGKPEQTSAGDIAAYVQAKELEVNALVVEHNGRVVASGQWAQTPLNPGDRLELLSFVGGG